MSRALEVADWLSFAEARARILSTVAPLSQESRRLDEALGRVLGEDVVAPVDLPPWDNSAMDGFAVRTEDVRDASATHPRLLRVVDDIPAGRFPSRPIGQGEAARVMTGAPVPAGADAVIRVEHTDGGQEIGQASGQVRIDSDADAGRNIRPRGEDIRRGNVAIARGTVLRPAHIGVAASLGYAQLQTIRRPRVAILASGDELVEVEHFAEVRAGRKIVSSNSYALAAQLAEWGMEADPLGIAADSPQSVREHLERAKEHDAIVTSAGVSVGEHDYLRAVLRSMGADVLFWRVRMRPGSALAFGRVHGLGGAPWFGLPGNPISTLVTSELLVRPALLRMAGHTNLFRPCVSARLEAPAQVKAGLTHFLRATVRKTPECWSVLPARSQSSAALSVMAGANALLHIPEDRGGFAAGDHAAVLLLDGAPLQPEQGC